MSMLRGGRPIAMGKLFMGGLTTTAQLSILGTVQATLEQAPVDALLNTARRQGASAVDIAAIERRWDALYTQLESLDAFIASSNASEAEARNRADAIVDEARALVREAEILAGSRNLSAPVLWGAGVILAAVGITYVVWKHRMKVRRRRYR